MDPDPGYGAFLTSGSRMGKNPDLASGIRDESAGSYFLELSISSLGLKYLNSFMRIRIRDWIRDPGSGFATLLLGSSITYIYDNMMGKEFA